MFSCQIQFSCKSTLVYFKSLKQKAYLLFLLSLMLSSTAFSQSSKKKIDSLETLIRNKKSGPEVKKAETMLLNLYFHSGNVKAGLKYSRKQIRECKAENNKEDLVNAYYSLVNFFFQANELDSVISYNDSLLKYAKLSDNRAKIIIGINNIGSGYFLKDDFKKALVYYDSALRVEERYGFPEGKYASVNNVGMIYMESNIPRMAIKYFLKSEKNSIATNDLQKLIYAYDYLTDSYLMLEKNDSALFYARKSLQKSMKLNSETKIITSVIAVGNVFKGIKRYDSALVYYNKALELTKRVNNAYISYALYYGLAEVYLKTGQTKEAEVYAERLRALPSEYSVTNEQKQLYNLFANLDYKRGKYKSAYDYLNSYIAYRDSCYNTEVAGQISEINTKYETEKKERENQLLQAKNDLATSSIKQQRTIILFTIGGLVVTLVLMYFIFLGFRKQREANKIISEQKKVVEEQAAQVAIKHKEITDSINYAERIQRSFLATEKLLSENLKNYFVFFKPRDIVSGDFYWAGILQNGNFALVTADSTGHGVPGAIMSILNISSIEKAVEKGFTEPSEILNQTRKTIIERLSNDGSKEGGKDGMDASLISFNFPQKTLTYSAANNPVWIVRGNTIIELKPDKMPVGKHEKDEMSFSQNQINLQTNDMIYTLTDGYSDQFGGPKSKKFMHKQLKQLLISVSGMEPSIQRQQLEKYFNEWKGKLEQVDDVCLIGVRIS